MKVISYNIEYDLPIDRDADDVNKIKTLAGYIEYIMDDIINDLGMEKYKLQFYYMVNHVILDMIIKMEVTKDVR